MKSAALVVALLLVSFFGSQLSGQDYPVKPSPGHKLLKSFVGTWDVEISMNMPDGQQMTSKGVETVEMLGELWNVFDFKYDFMGQPVSGHGIFGYDPQKKKYVGTWHESGSPYASSLEGTYEEESKKLTYMMSSKDMAGKDAKYKIVMACQDDRHRTFEMHTPTSDGTLAKSMEMKYTKRK